jgi:hypothetical protein
VKPLWIVKWLNYEYWPTWLIYSFISPYLLYLGIKCRSLTFFTNVNPIWKDGGMIHYNKNLINVLLPKNLRPQSLFLKSDYFSSIDFENIVYPIIVKPAAGERGKDVVKIDNKVSLTTHLATCNSDQIIESFISLPNEAGIFVVRKPDGNIIITSITQKKFLHVIGDGKSTIHQLMMHSDRARMQIYRFNDELLQSVPKDNENILLEPIGNHNRGTKFLNANHKIDSKINAVFTKVIDDIPSFNYGRFDIKYNTWDELINNENWLIIEVNGVNSEPTHIYDQGTGLLQSLVDLCKQWRLISGISISQKNKNNKPLSLSEFFKHLLQSK